MKRSPQSVLFVCLGNICRSPAAENIFRHRLAQHQSHGLSFEIDSAGTSAIHQGEAPDPRMRRALEEHGISVSGISRGFVNADFDRFDLILVADQSNLRNLLKLPNALKYQDKIKLIGDYHPVKPGIDIPDPYWGGPDGFSEVIDLLEICIAEMLCQWRLTR